MNEEKQKNGKPDQDFLTVGVLRTLDNMTTYVVVRMKLPNEAREDIWQDLALAALKARDNFRPAAGDPDAWDRFAGTVIRNAAKDMLPAFYREAARRAEPMLPVRDGDSEDEGREPPAAEPEDPNADVYRDLSRIELRERIASLEPKLRDAARLLMDGLAISAIAGRIGVARSSLYRYILPELRKALAEFAGAF